MPRKARKKSQARGGFLPSIPGVNWTDTFDLHQAGMFGGIMAHFLKGK